MRGAAIFLSRSSLVKLEGGLRAVVIELLLDFTLNRKKIDILINVVKSLCRVWHMVNPR